MRRDKLSELLIKTEFWLMVGVVLFTLLARASIVSLLFYCTFFILFFLLIKQLLTQGINLVHICLAVCMMLSLIHVCYTSSALSFGYLRKYIMFSCTLLLFVYIYKMNVTGELVEAILKVNIVIALLYPLVYYTRGPGELIAKSITLNFSNPNLTGMYLLHSLLYCVLAFRYFKQKLVRVLLLILSTQLYMLMGLTRARSCIIAFWGFVIMVVVSHLWGGKITVTKFFSFCMVMLPLVIVFVYLYLCNAGYITKNPEVTMFESADGKSMMSRYKIWTNALEYYRASPIFGAYGTLGGESGMSQMHNTHLDVLVSYGTVPFVLFLFVLGKSVNRVLTCISTAYQKIALFAFYAVLISGSFEAALVSGGVGMYILSCGFLIIAKHQISLDKAETDSSVQ